MTLKQAKLENAYGLYLPEKSAIYIQNNLNPKNYFRILLHELAHFLVDKAEKKPTTEEAFALLTEEFITIFLQNPKLLKNLNLFTRKNET